MCLSVCVSEPVSVCASECVCVSEPVSASACLSVCV